MHHNSYVKTGHHDEQSFLYYDSMSVAAYCTVIVIDLNIWNFNCF